MTCISTAALLVLLEDVWLCLLIGLAGWESSVPLPDFVARLGCESLRVGHLGGLIGWVVIEARRLVGGCFLRMWENETETIIRRVLFVVFEYYCTMT
jgi:hypothetical protein